MLHHLVQALALTFCLCSWVPDRDSVGSGCGQGYPNLWALRELEGKPTVGKEAWVLPQELLEWAQFGTQGKAWQTPHLRKESHMQAGLGHALTQSLFAETQTGKY